MNAHFFKNSAFIFILKWMFAGKFSFLFSGYSERLLAILFNAGLLCFFQSSFAHESEFWAVPGCAYVSSYPMKSTMFFGKSQAFENDDYIVPEEAINPQYLNLSCIIPIGKGCGFFTSKRSGYGKDDLFRYEFRRRVGKVTGQQREYRHVIILDKETQKPIPDVKLLSCERRYFLSDSAGRITFPVLNFECPVRVTAFGYLPMDQMLKVLPNKYSSITDTLWLRVATDQRIILKDLYFPVDKADIQTKSAKDLDKIVRLMKENPKYRIELFSYSDDSGSDELNLQLSQSRIETVINYLVAKNIEKYRIDGKGYGKSFPLYKASPGKSLTLKEHRENRRIEMRISLFSPIKIFRSDLKDSIAEANLKTLPFRYYLILNTYKSPEQAAIFFKNAQAEGLKVILLQEKEKYRVAIGYQSLDIAKKSLLYFKEKYRYAWIQERH